MSSLNKVMLIGHVGKDPETRYLEGNVALTRFSLATSESYKNKNGENVTQTDWHNIVLWRGLAEVAQKYVKKGSQVYIEGRLTTRSYDDKDGNKKYNTEIVASSMFLLGRRSDGSGQESENRNIPSGQSETPRDSEPGIDIQGTDDLPF